MTQAFRAITYTPAVRAVQESRGVRQRALPPEGTAPEPPLTAAEAEFIEARDGFYQATVGETGWPYVQFRGGPPGFLKVLDEHAIGYADFRGNMQYVSAGNLSGDDRVSLILMDYANRRRLKILGHARLVEAAADPELVARLEVPSYRARIERAVLIRIAGFDWNCPQHITPRYTPAEFAAFGGAP